MFPKAGLVIINGGGESTESRVPGCTTGLAKTSRHARSLLAAESCNYSRQGVRRDCRPQTGYRLLRGCGLLEFQLPLIAHLHPDRADVLVARNVFVVTRHLDYDVVGNDGRAI